MEYPHLSLSLCRKLIILIHKLKRSAIAWQVWGVTIMSEKLLLAVGLTLSLVLFTKMSWSAPTQTTSSIELEHPGFTVSQVAE